jgi:hypothetical protein
MHQPNLYFNMDFMCEPFVLKKTGGTVKEHQQKSIDNQIKIIDEIKKRDIKGEFAGVIQGWTIPDYLQHIDMLKAQGLILPKMGIGSICRRNARTKIIEVIQTIKNELPNTRFHGFGVKYDILREPLIHDCLETADSMAWSFDGRKETSRPCANTCIYPNQKNCANCYVYMLQWYNKVQNVQKEAVKQQRIMNYA